MQFCQSQFKAIFLECRWCQPLVIQVILCFIRFNNVINAAVIAQSRKELPEAEVQYRASHSRHRKMLFSYFPFSTPLNRVSNYDKHRYLQAISFRAPGLILYYSRPFVIIVERCATITFVVSRRSFNQNEAFGQSCSQAPRT